MLFSFIVIPVAFLVNKHFIRSQHLIALMRMYTLTVRTHHLLPSKVNSSAPDLKWGFTNAYKEENNGNAVYYRTTVDSIIDTKIQKGIRAWMGIRYIVAGGHTWMNCKAFLPTTLQELFK